MKIVLFSDVHANLPAFEKALEEIEKQKPDAIYCLGDLVGYHVFPNEVINKIRKRRIPTIAGNHDAKVKKLSEKQNAQFTELMTEIRKVGGLIEQQEEYNSDDVSDDIYEEAKAVVIKERKASTSYLQRKLGVGYARAANLIDMLEEQGVIGPGSGAKPREVLINE